LWFIFKIIKHYNINQNAIKHSNLLTIINLNCWKVDASVLNKNDLMWEKLCIFVCLFFDVFFFTKY